MKLLNSKTLLYFLVLPFFAACELKEDSFVAEVVKEESSKNKNVAIHLQKSLEDSSGISLQMSVDSFELIIRKNEKLYRLVLIEDQVVEIGEHAVEGLIEFNSLFIAEEIEVLALQLLLKKDQHMALDLEGNLCEIQSLSAKRRLVQIPLSRSVHLQESYDYDLRLSINLEESIELKRNGGCRLKLILRLPIFLRRAKSRLGDGMISLDRLMTDGLDENQTDEKGDGFLDLVNIKGLPILRL
ncbi:MAG: hypothetical protein VX642_06290 [Bdellovibrionota bacterium]|nr:hypothetical protein [Bdellovibrionota bacterium]